ncbi:RagB/SusD family nutrient uptake outer membrane protein [Sphingobacterium corticibacterium]|uniref:RagB/SusD family nutrient uptake outer membrane protein n=1 Tax=Sphingobacterium corticibacterium TaxID=2484746 RepID=A0A4Q6XHT3_9SPHI|nr:RagB/SusD family nutrient uptake outer membrane protein [Sphingobacterium corticibacterium]RZF58725.1 RagB/SusD family nutrient uptake outer membrane protein [Sphingobacterium corticibacterium]
MKIKFIIILIVSLLSLSCDKFLDKEPENKVSIEEIFADLPGAKAALTGVYLDMFSTSYFNGPRMVYPELTGGNLRHAYPTRTSLLDLFHFSADADSSSMNTVYSHLYSMLNNINNILTRVPDLADGTAAERNEILAQAHGIRALIHLDLVQLFAQPYRYTSDASHLGIVIADEPILVGNAQRRRATVAEVYDQIASDLQLATDLFANSKRVFTGNRVQYMNTSALKALYARLCLHKQDWEGASLYSSQVIAENFTLYSREEYLPSWKTAAAKETILEVAVPTGHGGNSLGNYYVNESSNSYFQFAPSEDLLELFSEHDIRSAGGIFKYDSYNFEATSVKIIRLSEMYLIRAEALAEMGETEEAIADLNLIRLRADPEQEPWTTQNKQALIDEILNERRRELCLEGFLFFDLMRRGLSVERSDCEGTNCNMSYPSDRFVLPIPQQSVYSNNHMEQNPGY